MTKVKLIKCSVCGHGRDEHQRCRHCTVDRIVNTWNIVKDIDKQKRDLAKSQNSLRKDRMTVLRTHNNLYRTLTPVERILLDTRLDDMSS